MRMGRKRLCECDEVPPPSRQEMKIPAIVAALRPFAEAVEVGFDFDTERYVFKVKVRP